MIAIPLGIIHKLFDANGAAAPVDGDTHALPAPGSAKLIGWTTAFATAPSACSIKVQHSMDGTNWDDLDESTATAGEFRTVTTLTPANFIRGVKSSQTGGGALTLSVIVTI